MVLYKPIRTHLFFPFIDPYRCAGFHCIVWNISVPYVPALWYNNGGNAIIIDLMSFFSPLARQPKNMTDDTTANGRRRSVDWLRCAVERLTYRNETNGYSVIQCSAKGYQALITAVGRFNGNGIVRRRATKNNKKQLIAKAFDKVE